jgi:hypothetical protein
MTEMEFIEAIDALFFFDTDEEYEEATRIACSISDNAALMVGYELATLSSHASQEVNLRLLQIMMSERPTPIVLAAIPVIQSLLKNEVASPEEVYKLLDLCRQERAWNGLGIVECADEALEQTCREIYEEWEKASS